MPRSSSSDETSGSAAGHVGPSDLSRWHPPTALTPVVLEGHRVRVEPLDLARHAGALWPRIGGAERADLWTYMSAGPFPDGATFADGLAEAYGATGLIAHALVLPNAGAAGLACYMRDVPAHGCVDLAPPARGKISHLHSASSARSPRPCLRCAADTSRSVINPCSPGSK